MNRIAIGADEGYRQRLELSGQVITEGGIADCRIRSTVHVNAASHP